MKPFVFLAFVLAFAVGAAVSVWSCGDAPPAATNGAAAPGSTPGVSTPGASTPGASTPSASTPGTVPPRPGAPASSPTLTGKELVGAASLFNANCASCHTQTGAGEEHHRKDGIPDFRDPHWRAAHDETETVAAITNGAGPVMPAFKGRLSDEQIRTLATYVRTFPDRVVFTPSAAAKAAPKGGTATAAKPSAGAPATPSAKPAAPDHEHMHHP